MATPLKKPVVQKAVAQVKAKAPVTKAPVVKAPAQTAPAKVAPKIVPTGNAVIDSAKKAWNDAYLKGDKAGMAAAHASAEGERSKSGFSGGSDGSRTLLLKPQLEAMAPDAYQDALVGKATAGVNSSAATQYANIENALADTLAGLETEKAQVNPTFQNALAKIKQNQFDTTETQKELMNQSGWTTQNSGLAVGEVGKIAIGADKERADAEEQQALALADLARRVTQAKNKAVLDRTSVDNWKSAQLSGAEADALINSDARSRDLYADQMGQYNTDLTRQDNRGDVAWNRNYQAGRDKVEDQRNAKIDSQNAQKIAIDQQATTAKIATDRIKANKPSGSSTTATKAKQTAEAKTVAKSAYNEWSGAKDKQAWYNENAKYLSAEELYELNRLINGSPYTKPKAAGSSGNTLEDFEKLLQQ